jgi:hypothetical protein
MTLPPERIGDKDQRYEIRFEEKDRPGEQVLGWTVSREGAKAMAKTCSLRPSVKRAWVIDRQLGKTL